MENQNEQILKSALNGDINAFQQLFSGFQNQLKSYLYRLLTSRSDTEDLLHDTFIKSFDSLSTFKGRSSLKTWVFQIATNLAYNYLKSRKRWQSDVLEQGKKLAMSEPEIFQAILKISQNSNQAVYDIKEHIDTCFTCISKTLPIENQIALLLKDIYEFSVNEICLILGKTEGIVKHLLIDARKTLTAVFDNRCALINKNGICNQCSELNGAFNPKQKTQEERAKLNWAKDSNKFNQDELFKLRTILVKGIDPLNSNGADLQEALLKCNKMAVGETTDLIKVSSSKII
jgi:RNA polymerase sigma-70 factor, ECF subfamily